MGCPRQHHPRPTAARGTRGEPGRERLAVHPGHLAFDPRFQDLRRHRRSLLPSLEHSQASTRARHLNRRARMGPSGGSIERWYYLVLTDKKHRPPRNRNTPAPLGRRGWMFWSIFRTTACCAPSIRLRSRCRFHPAAGCKGSFLDNGPVCQEHIFKKADFQNS